MIPGEMCALCRSLQSVSPGEIHRFLLCSRCSSGTHDRDGLPAWFVNFITQEIAGSIGGDSMILLIVVLLQLGYPLRAIEQFVRTLQHGLAIVCRTFGKDTLEEWDPDLYLRASFEGSVGSPELRAIRTRFWRHYVIAVRLTQRWIATRSAREQRLYSRYVLPGINGDLVKRLTGSCHHR